MGLNDRIALSIGTPGEIVEVLKRKLSRPEYCHSFPFAVGPYTERRMSAYAGILNEAGLDIGKDQQEFGYKIAPLKRKNPARRNMVIFRRY